MKNAENILQSSMSIITSAGDGRTSLAQVMEAVNRCDFEAAEAYLKEAYQSIASAHIEQTRVIQESINCEGDISENEESVRLLFTHAQDTVMTINSEYLVIKELVNSMKNIDMRLKKMEEMIYGKQISG